MAWRLGTTALKSTLRALVFSIVLDNMWTRQDNVWNEFPTYLDLDWLFSHEEVTTHVPSYDTNKWWNHDHVSSRSLCSYIYMECIFTLLLKWQFKNKRRRGYADWFRHWHHHTSTFHYDFASASIDACPPSRSGIPNHCLTMYPFSIFTDEHVPLKLKIYLIIDNNKYIMIF